MKRTILLIAALLSSALVVWTQTVGLPAGEADAQARLNDSPRHGEWVTYSAEGGDRVDAWVVYPERSDAAPVIVVIHENRGLNDWARAVTDQFAAEGFIAIAPDFLSGKAPGGGGTRTVDPDGARNLIGKLNQAEITRRLRGAVQYATSLPAASKSYGVVGYCWGGARSFYHATQDPNVKAVAVFYGTSPATELIRNIKAPVLGLYGGADNRVNATIPAAEAEMKRLGKRYEVEIYDGAGHAFLKRQDGQNGANLAATRKAWPRVIGFFKNELGDRMSSIPYYETKFELTGLTETDECCGVDEMPVKTGFASD
jgi:carboxymethylenebutenolidase